MGRNATWGRRVLMVRRARRGRAWIWVVLAVALTVRVWRIDWQLPDVLAHDELKYVSWAAAQVDGRALSRTDYRNPSLYRHLLALEYRVADAVVPDDDDQRQAVRRLLIARLTTAILGAGTVALAGLAAARLCSPAAGLVASLALGLSLLHVNLSHLALNDVPAAFFLTAGLFFGARGLIAPRPREYVLAGLAAGLAAAAKYNAGVIVCLPLAGAVTLAVMRAVRPARAARFVGLALAGGLAGLLVGMPEWLWATPVVLEGMAEQARIGTSPWVGQPEEPVPILFGRTVAHGIGWPTVVAALVGLAWITRASPWRALVLLVCPVIYLAVMLRNELFFARFALPLLPFVAIFAGIGVAQFAAWQPAGVRRATALGLALLAIGVPSGIDVAQHNRLATSTDTRVLAQEWISRRPRDSRVAAQTQSLPAHWAGHERLRGYRVNRFLSLADPAVLADIACDNPRYVLVASYAADRGGTRRPAGASTGYELLAQHGQLVQTFSPFRDGRQAAFTPDDTRVPFWDLQAYASTGPPIDVYQLSDEAAALCRRGRR